MRESTNVKLRDYQLKVISEMNSHFENKTNGVLVIPTGGGKTITAAFFLWKQFIDRQLGDDSIVLWMTHNIDLLEQTFQSFTRFFEKKNMAIVSSNHTSFEHLIKDKSKLDDLEILFASYLSCSTIKRKKVNIRTREKDVSLDNLRKVLKAKKVRKVFIVVDEAHRIAAPTYQRTINGLSDKFDTKLLGLTATPYRTTDRGQEIFDASFNQGKIKSAPTMNFLITQRFLAIPTPKTIKTNVHQNDLFGDPNVLSEFNNQRHYVDLTSRQLNSIGKNSQRNKVIVDTYAKGNFGKTIVFATDIIHCKTLEREFEKAGVKSRSVYSKGVIGKDENKEYQAQFIAEDSGIDVIINVNMLTEGIDMPNVETVFLARPTNSKSLFRQMIGRALRGPKSGGTEKANLVTFVDSWDSFQPIEGAEIVPDLQKESDSDSTIKPKSKQEWNLQEIINIYDKIHFATEISSSSFEPELIYRWLPIDSENSDELELIVFENWNDQLQGLINEAKEEGEMHKFNLQYISDIFKECCSPHPNQVFELEKIKSLLEFIDAGETTNTITVKDFLNISPQTLANKLVIKIANIESEDELNDKIIESATGYWKSNRETLKKMNLNQIEFIKEVKTAFDRKVNRDTTDDVVVNNLGLKEFKENQDGFDLVSIAKKVAAIYKEKYDDELIPTENWQDLEIRFSVSDQFRSTFAYHKEHQLSKKKEIIFSRQLNSPEVPRFVIEAIMFHELVHNRIGNKMKHRKEFREIEELFLPSVTAIAEVRKRTGTKKYDDYYKLLIGNKPILAERNFLRDLIKKRNSN